MNHKKQKDKIGATRGKLACVGVLALTLILVIVKQLPENGPADVRLQANAATQVDVSATSSQQKNASSTFPKKGTVEEKRELTLWPESNLAETLVKNPFELPSWAIPKKLEEVVDQTQPSQLLELQQLGATIIVITEGKKSATIGNKKYYVGDVFAGYRVTDITTQGILLDKL